MVTKRIKLLWLSVINHHKECWASQKMLQKQQTLRLQRRSDNHSNKVRKRKNRIRYKANFKPRRQILVSKHQLNLLCNSSISKYKINNEARAKMPWKVSMPWSKEFKDSNKKCIIHLSKSKSPGSSILRQMKHNLLMTWIVNCKSYMRLLLHKKKPKNRMLWLWGSKYYMISWWATPCKKNYLERKFRNRGQR